MIDIDLSVPNEVHVLGIEAMRLYAEGNKSLDAAAIAKLSSGLKGLHHDLQELLHAATGIGAAALHLEQQGDAESAEKLKALIKEQAPVFEGLKQQLSEELQDQAEKTTTQAAGLIGSAVPPRTAPRYDAPAPKGTTRLSDLVPNPALRPPTARKK